jgi:uncharacterized integral membrane protein (TIGR00698 family)
MTTDQNQQSPPPFRAVVAATLPGFLIALTVAAAANFVALAYGGPVMLLALLIGMALNFLSAEERALPGLRFATKQVLQIGVALLGLRIAFGDITALGTETLVLVIVGVVATIGAGIVLARLLGRTGTFGLLAGGATAICGASAALAISSALPPSKERDRETAFVIVIVTTLSTLAMVIYPVLAHLLGFDDRETGIMLGATIHDVAQVVGAGYAVSGEAGDAATIVKLFRVVLLLPVVFCISLAFRRSGSSLGVSRLPVPLFAVAFAVLVAVHSFHLLPGAVERPLAEISRWCLLTAVAAIGIRTSIPDMLKMGGSAIAVPAGATLVLLVLAAGFQFLTI